MLRSFVLSIMMFIIGSACMAAPGKIFVQPEGTSIAATGYDAQVYTMPDGLQFDISVPCNLPGPPVITTIGHPNADTIARFPALLAAVLQCPHIVGIYIIDEYEWNGTSEIVGQYEPQVCAAAHAAHTAGLLVTMSTRADALLSGDFTLSCLRDFDGIAFDYYPSINVWSVPFYGCGLGLNIDVNVVGCSVQRLRSIGYTGKIIYIYQAFRLTTDTDINILLNQRVAIDSAQALGVDYVAPWGLNLSAGQMENEPIVQLGGTIYAPLVLPN